MSSSGILTKSQGRGSRYIVIMSIIIVLSSRGSSARVLLGRRTAVTATTHVRWRSLVRFGPFRGLTFLSVWDQGRSKISSESGSASGPYAGVLAAGRAGSHTYLTYVYLGDFSSGSGSD